MRKILIPFFALMVVTGFVFSAPDPSIANRLVQIQIDEINKANADVDSRIAFAQEDETTPPSDESSPQGSDVPICCSNGETPNSGEYCDNSTCTPMCCPGGTNPNPGYVCDNTLTECGWTEEDEDQPDCEIDNSCQTIKVCADVNAQNYTDPNGQGPNGESLEPGGVCRYIDACCDQDAMNFDPVLCADPHYRHNQDICIDENPVCCNGNYDNYKSPSNREPEDVCQNSTCGCNATPPHSGSQCGDGSDDYCLIETGFSVIKSGVSIGGSAQMDTIAECGSEDEETLKNYVAGMAAADATPDTPLNTPITLDSLSSYTVTSKDYCLNVAGAQGSGDGYNRSENGLCCEPPNIPDDGTGSCVAGPVCGSSAGQTFESEPTSNLCASGNSSSLTTNTSSYTWTCSTELNGNTSEAQCSANRTCNGGSCEECTELDCGPNDQCKNITGSQDNSYLSSNNLAPDSYGVCWNATIGACGSVSQIPYVTETPSTNLCISGTQASPVSFDDGSGLYSWNCISNTNNNTIDPLCQVRQCVGGECQTNESTGLIRKFKAQPSIVSRAGGECLLTWETDIDSTITDPAQGCQINGNSVADNNTTGTGVGPGTYSLMCYLGVSYQIETVKCVMGPDFKEI